MTASAENAVDWLEAAETSQKISVRSMPFSGIEKNMTALTELLMSCIDVGDPLGFLAPIKSWEINSYWLSLHRELAQGSRVLLVAYAQKAVVACGQLFFPAAADSSHRAEVQNLFVHPLLRQRGVGRLMMSALHEVARQHGKSLMTLITHGGAGVQNFCKQGGYSVAGVVPGYAHGSQGEPRKGIIFYQVLKPPAAPASTGRKPAANPR